ncbi:MAG: glycosyltransferase [Bacteroidaceae bacterium]|nr:glycosyltransferase [Bacteroidaceae bacterium]
MSLKLSFILPCYNVEPYISDCLNSIYTQDISEDEFEVICVNDRSTDNTGHILNKYMSVHENMSVINHSVNQTLGGARNSGLKAARGLFLWFVDPDDYIPCNCLKELIGLAEGRDADILMFNHRVVNSGKEFVKDSLMFSDSDVTSGQEYILKYTPNNISAHTIVWCCLYKTSFLHDNGFMFPAMRKGADDSFQWRAMLYAERVFSTEKVYYVYRVNPDSVSNKTYLADVVFSDRILNAHQINMLLHDDGLKIRKEIGDDLMKTMRWLVNSTMEMVANMSAAEQSKYYREIDRNREIVKSLMPYMSRKSRCLYSLSGGHLVWKTKLNTLLWLERRKHKNEKLFQEDL